MLDQLAVAKEFAVGLGSFGTTATFHPRIGGKFDAPYVLSTQIVPSAAVGPDAGEVLEQRVRRLTMPRLATVMLHPGDMVELHDGTRQVLSKKSSEDSHFVSWDLIDEEDVDDDGE